MTNMICLVGRLISDPVVNESEGKTNCVITIAVSRFFKNENGEYETDFIPIILLNNIAKNTAEYCQKGDLIGIKGRVQTEKMIINGEEKDNKLIIIAEKVTFLSSKKENK